MFRTENGVVIRLADDHTSNIVGWVPGNDKLRVTNSYTIIKAHPSDFNLEVQTECLPSAIPDFMHMKDSRTGETYKGNNSIARSTELNIQDNAIPEIPTEKNDNVTLSI